MKKNILIIAMIMWFVPAVCGADSQGGFAGSFLEIPVDARATAMGGAFNAVSNDGAAILHNPAGIQATTDKLFNSSYRVMELDRKLGFVSFILPTRQQSSVGFSWLYAGYGEVEGRDPSGRIDGNTYSANEHAFSVSFAKRFLPYLALGTRLNYYTKKMDYLSASSVGINLGAMLYVDSLFRYGSMEGKPITDMTAGLIIKNLAAQYPWETEGTGLNATQEDKFPLSLGVGSSFRALQRQLLVALDLELLVKTVEWEAEGVSGSSTQNETYTDAYFRFGGEYTVKDNFMIRAGMNNGSLTAGAGFMFNFDKAALQFNYAFSDHDVDKGDDHIISLGIRF